MYQPSYSYCKDKNNAPDAKGVRGISQLFVVGVLLDIGIVANVILRDGEDIVLVIDVLPVEVARGIGHVTFEIPVVAFRVAAEANEVGAAPVFGPQLAGALIQQPGVGQLGLADPAVGVVLAGLLVLSMKLSNNREYNKY